MKIVKFLLVICQVSTLRHRDSWQGLLLCHWPNSYPEVRLCKCAGSCIWGTYSTSWHLWVNRSKPRFHMCTLTCITQLCRKDAIWQHQPGFLTQKEDVTTLDRKGNWWKHLNHSWQQCWHWEECTTWEIGNEPELDSFSSRCVHGIELHFDCSETITHCLNLFFEVGTLSCQHNLQRNEGLCSPDISVKRGLTPNTVECFCNQFWMCPFYCNSCLNTVISLTSN